MSRLGKKPLLIPDKVEIKVESNAVSVKGPLGTLQLDLLSDIKLEIADQKVTVNRQSDSKEAKATQGLILRLLNNAIVGVTQGFEKSLEVNGVGFKINMKGKNLELSLGFSHPVLFTPPSGIEIKIDKNIILVKGIDKQLVGETAAKIRDLKKPEPYKGKGIKYVEEHIHRKSGKMAAAAGS